MLLGHQGVIGALSSQLPPVSIITGPQSVGKRMIATYAAIKNNIPRLDFTEVKKLTVDESDRVKQFMLTRPSKNFKFALIDLDTASEPAIHDLLKLLEEPPTYARFSLISSRRVPATVLTRGQRYSVGLLGPDELYSILVEKNIPYAEAKKLSILGRVDLALKAYSDSFAKSTALNVLQSIADGDYALFVQAYKAVDENAANSILLALQESAAQKWTVFNPEHLGAFSNRGVALKVLSSWSTVASAKPQLAVRAALESVMRG